MIWALQSTYYTSPESWGHCLSYRDDNDNDKHTHKDKDKDEDKDKDKVLKRPITCYIFEKQGVQGYQIWRLQGQGQIQRQRQRQSQRQRQRHAAKWKQKSYILIPHYHLFLATADSKALIFITVWSLATWCHYQSRLILLTFGDDDNEKNYGKYSLLKAGDKGSGVAAVPPFFGDFGSVTSCNKPLILLSVKIL